MSSTDQDAPSSAGQDAPSTPDPAPPAAGRNRPLARHFWTIVFVACVGLFFWNELRSTRRGSARPVTPSEVLSPGSASGFNVLLITLDTTRQDYLTCYGYPRAITPTITSLAEHGVRFDDAVTSAPMTLPSHTVMMTGLYPPSSGVRDNGGYVLLDGHVTLAERLKQRGYDTAAFVSAFVLDRRFGLAQGFDVYDFQIDDEGRSGGDSLLSERDAAAVTASALKWFKQRPSDHPFFAWVHYFDPHQPYTSPLMGTEGFEDRGYEAEIAFADQNIGRLLDALDARGLRDNTLVVFVTDHGEGLLEHDEQMHGIFLYESTVRVGLILSNPRLFDRAYCVNDRVVATADIAPTVLDLVGAQPLDGVDGVSLASASPDPDRAVYLETLMPLANACAPLHALRTHQYKFILAPRKELYDIAQDRGEQTNLYGTPGGPTDLETRLLSMLAKWEAGGQALAGAREMGEDVKRRLESLGYTMGQAPTGDTDNLRDPKDQIHVINQMSEVKHLESTGHAREALALAQDVTVQAGGWYAPVSTIAEIHNKLGEPAQAARVLERYIHDYPDAAPAQAYLHLAEALFVLKRDQECLARLEQAQQRDPEMGMVAIVRGDLFARNLDYQKAIEQYEQGNRLDPLRVGPMYRDRVSNVRKLMRQKEKVSEEKVSG